MEVVTRLIIVFQTRFYAEEIRSVLNYTKVNVHFDRKFQFRWLNFMNSFRLIFLMTEQFAFQTEVILFYFSGNFLGLKSFIL